MAENPYTHAMWRVREGREQDFIDAWSALAEVFAALPSPPTWGTLLQSLEEPTLFFSFGPWKKLEDIQAMRENPKAQAGLEHLRSLCVEAKPGAYRQVLHVVV